MLLPYKQLLQVLLLLGNLSIYAQTQTFLDPRDGQEYETVVIGNKVWFRQDLRFETSTSFCPNYNKDDFACKDGNFYSYKELDMLCPADWHVATIEDWDSFIAYIKLPDAVFTYDTLPEPKYSIRVEFDKPDLFTTDNLLQLKNKGWVQGNRYRTKASSLSYWVPNKLTFDDKFHIHVVNNFYIKHSHKHHIDAHPKRQRKFLVRCVKDL